MKRSTLAQIKRNVASNMSPRNMARLHISWIRIYRAQSTSTPFLEIRDAKIEERIRLLRLALSDRRAEVSACLRGAA